MSTPSLDDELSKSPLTVAEHGRRNWLMAALMLACAVLPPVMLQPAVVAGLSEGLGTPAAFAAPFVAEVRQFLPAYDLIEIPFVGWLLLPALFFWLSIARELSTDGKLKSTETIHGDHLQHAADRAKARIRNEMLTDAEVEDIANTIGSLGLAKYVARKTFAARRHEIAAASFWPWVFATSALVATAILYWMALPYFEIPIETERTSGALIGGLIVMAVTIVHKARRYRRFFDFWASYDLDRFARQQANSNAKKAAT